MVVQMDDAAFLEVAGEDARLQKIEDLPEKGLEPRRAQAEGQGEGVEPAPGGAGDQVQMGGDQGEGVARGIEDAEGARGFGLLVGADDGGGRSAADGAGFDGQAEAAEATPRWMTVGETWVYSPVR